MRETRIDRLADLLKTRRPLYRRTPHSRQRSGVFERIFVITHRAITPIMVGRGSETLVRVHLGKGVHNEKWLQALIHKHPEVLPVAQIEPAFGRLVAAAREVACGHGYIDNVYLTSVGEIVIVETKLWSNPQARREVVSQALDYASALASMTYEQFEAAVIRAASGPTGGPASLYAIIADQPDVLDDPAFVDAVAMNLRRGRMLVIAAGDGVRREAETLASLLQGHAGAHFTFAMVELAAYRVGDADEYLIVPSTLLRTVMVERGVVTIEQGQVVMKPPSTVVAGGDATSAAKSITEASFLELMAAHNPALPTQIQAFIKSVEPLGVYAEYAASLNLKLDWEGSAKPISLGYIQKNGRLQTGTVGWHAPKDAARRYVETLTSLIGGAVGTANGWFYVQATPDGYDAATDRAVVAGPCRGLAGGYRHDAERSTCFRA
jgi:hypothetical protein